MNKVKEKKLNSIKSDILEIKDFVISSNINNSTQILSKDNLNDKTDDTITLTKIVDFAFLGIFNKLLGGVFNMIISAFIVSVIFMFFNEWNATEYVISEEKKNNSYLYESIANLAPLILPDLIEEIENIDIPKDILDINKSEKKQ